MSTSLIYMSVPFSAGDPASIREVGDLAGMDPEHHGNA
jgi:hypothetical protein